jgi:DNA-binding transcriptional ArsR family regulator
MGRPKASKYGGNDKQLLHQIKELATLLSKVRDPTRLHIILILANRELNVGEVCRELGMAQNVVSYHLAFLSLGGIVDYRRQGSKNYYSLTEKGDLVVGVINEIAG